MLHRLSASVLALCLLSATAANAASSCFTPTEAKAAKFRAMQQEFNVAALNCQSVDPNDPTPSIRDRYNSFVSSNGSLMQDNARSLKAHFSRVGGNFDRWMTQIANDAGQRVMTDTEFCQRASDNLDKVMALPSTEQETFADGVTPASFVPACAEKATPTATKKAKEHKAKAKPHKNKAAEKKEASAQ